MNEMKITSIRIKKNNNKDSNTLGIASIEFNNCFIVHDIRLVQLKDKRIISFPNKKVKKYSVSGDSYNEIFEYSDIAHPSTKEFREYIQQELFKIYDNEIGGRLNEQDN